MLVPLAYQSNDRCIAAMFLPFTLGYNSKIRTSNSHSDQVYFLASSMLIHTVSNVTITPRPPVQLRIAFKINLRTIYKMSGRSLSVYKDTSASHEYLCTLIKNGHEFCKLLLKRTQIVVQ